VSGTGSTQPLNTTEEIIGRKSSGSGLENGKYSRRDPSRSPSGTFYQQKLALTSLRSGGLSVGIVRSWTEAAEFSLVLGFFTHGMTCPYTRHDVNFEDDLHTLWIKISP
jgi:hypothetical protein